MGIALLLVLLGLVAGFTLGWIARRDDARRYLESRERYWRGLLAEALDERDDAEWTASRLESAPAPAPAQTVVNVIVPTAGYPLPVPMTVPALPALPEVAAS